MWSDILTKSKQGSPFKRMRAELMNCAVEYDDVVEARITHPDLLPGEESSEISNIPGERVANFRAERIRRQL